jgi:cold shock CspA family protein
VTGRVKSITWDRGFFFVTGEDGNDYFAHRSALSDEQLFDDLRKGDPMELLEVANTPKGWRVNKLMPVATPAA